MTRKTGKVVLNVAPHPFSLERVTHQLGAGVSLADMVQAAQPDAALRACAHVSIDGHYIDRQLWGRVYPKAGTTISMRMVPQGGGGGGKNPLRTILTIAVLAASPVVAGSLAGALGATGSILGISTAKLITGGVNILGRLALNALAPPARPRANAGRREAPVYFVQGAQNKVEPFARIPKVLGRHRSVPPLGAMPYTETQGSDQYLRMLFVWGYGPLEISDLKIGETPLSTFEGVEVETRQGYADDAPLTLYSNAVLQNDLQVALRHSDAPAIRVSEAEAEELSVDITFPRGLFRFGSANNKRPSTVELEICYAPVGSEAWSTGAQTPRSVAAQTVSLPAAPQASVAGGVVEAAARYDRIALDVAAAQIRIYSGEVVRGADAQAPMLPSVPAGVVPLARLLRRHDESGAIDAGIIADERSSLPAGMTFGSVADFACTPGTADNEIAIAAGSLTYRALVATAAQASAVRRAVSFKVPKGQYQVRIRRLTADASDDNTFNECSWTALRSVRATRPIAMAGLAVTALRIKATDQLNGVIDRFNGVVTALIPDWTGSAWVVQPTSNPAAIYRHVLQGAGNGRPLADSRLDLAKIEAWHARCALRGERYDAIIAHDASVRDVLHEVAACGRASPALVDGRWSVVEDIEQSVPIQHFTPRNTFNFEGQKAFDDQPQALRVRFINRDKGWAPDERLVFADGYSESTATDYETLELPGVTGASQAWRQGRYHLATALLRPETYQFTVDIEHLVCTRGDLVRLTHDVPMFGLASARVLGVTVEDGNVVALTLDSDIEMQAGKTYSLRCRKTDGSSCVMALQTVAGITNTVTLALPLASAVAPVAGDLAMFGESGQDSVALIVKGIEPLSDLSARVTCVDAAPEIYAADQAAIPPFRSNISINDTARMPPAPEIAGMQSGEESLIRHTDGSLTTRIVITLRPPAFAQNLTLAVQIRGEGESQFVAANILDQSATQVSIVGVEEGQRYDLALRYLASNNRVSPPRIISGYQVAGTAALPSDVTGFDISVLGDHAYLRWQAVRDADLSHYVIRHCADEDDAAWSNALDVATSLPYDATSATLPALPGSYLIKAVDIGGRFSAVAAVVRSPVGGFADSNLVLDIDEGAAFAGVKTDLARIDGDLRLDSLGSVDDAADVDLIANLDMSAAGLRSSGVYTFATVHDLGAVYTARVTAALSAQGFDTATSLDEWGDTDAAESWDCEVDPSQWSAVLQISTTQQDPALESGWTDWHSLTVGDYTARAYRLRLLLTGSGATITPVISALQLRIDMPDRYASGVGITAPAGGIGCSYTEPFRVQPALQITPYDLQAGDYWQVTAASEYGFTVQFFNSADSSVVRVFDYTAKGYGRALDA